ncbi:hypothetical protein [Evansella cellulosilytica]|uniref:Uncharacterized protein n=1 Tax=Evansella cellulosilytica (strain ATCC 21833 / DSM 2522 / FERM P-1141 / JCM 9156 / N-4) TaxID=649639 RepID=E6TWY9_EVAC2|nr:hypothetical protein [Evansella cellulosilytica]ADU29939.1 hypothetical protein Bcell_1676 [Evansella cellulosilytica DSM 2522]
MHDHHLYLQLIDEFKDKLGRPLTSTELDFLQWVSLAEKKSQDNTVC